MESLVSTHKEITHRKDAKNAKNAKLFKETFEQVIPAKAGIQYLTDSAQTGFPLSRE
jgi:hypothetical protein